MSPISFNDGRLPGAPTSRNFSNEGRRSVRLADYDYSQAGWYFVTIMAQGRQPVFGNINADAVLEPSLVGQVVAAGWHQLGSTYSHVHPDVWQLMPDHVHFILGLLPNSRKPKPLGQLVGAFKAAVTREVRTVRPDITVLWQRNYYEHITRSAKELEATRAYIRNNPRRRLEQCS